MQFIYPRNSNLFKIILFASGFCGIVWGSAAVLFAHSWLDSSAHAEFFQAIGLYEIALGIAFLLAVSNPLRNWQIVLAGLIVKVLLSLGYLYYNLTKTEPEFVFQMIFITDMVWILPFILILYNAYKHDQLLDNEMIRLQSESVNNALLSLNTNKKNNLLKLSEEYSVLLIFLRHFGCSFCRDTLLRIAELRKGIENKDIKIVLVNMYENETAEDILAEYHLEDIDYVADEESLLYKTFKLRRATLSQFISLKVFINILKSLFKKKVHITAGESADTFQMPGIFLIKNGNIIQQYNYTNIADTPPILEIIRDASLSQN